MAGVSGKISIGESNAAKGCAAQDFTACRLSILAKEETRLRAAVSVSPAIQHHARNVTLYRHARSHNDLKRFGLLAPANSHLARKSTGAKAWLKPDVF